MGEAAAFSKRIEFSLACIITLNNFVFQYNSTGDRLLRGKDLGEVIFIFGLFFSLDDKTG